MILAFALAVAAPIHVAAQKAEPKEERVASPQKLGLKPPLRSFERFDLPVNVRVHIVLLTTLATVWFFWLGAALGSYLNVVVYRMPLGLPSVAPDSRCPKCQTPIRWYDNIPVVSWLVLRGRCRSCREPISPRYLNVEVLMGSLFVGLLVLEVVTGGAVFPSRPVRGYAGMPWIEHFMEWDLLAIYFYHAALVWFIVGIVLFWIDGHWPPTRYLLAGVLVALVPPLVWPGLRHWPFVALESVHATPWFA